MTQEQVPPIKFAITTAGGPAPLEMERFDTREKAEAVINERDNPEDFQVAETR